MELTKHYFVANGLTGLSTDEMSILAVGDGYLEGPAMIVSASG